MIDIQCPHCEQGIELDDNDSGLFECPFCEKEFEWNMEKPINYDDSFNVKDFLIGIFVPSIPSAIGIFCSFVLFDGWDSLIWFVLSFLIWPVIALGFLIYGYIIERRFMVFGTALSFVFMLILFFILPIFN